jgi:hypothetical protein
LLPLALLSPAARTAEKPACAAAALALWGDGTHDDTRALNAWFNGDPVVWADTGRAVGLQIVGRVFRLSSTVYIPSGTGRRIERFEMVWPARRERVAGSAIVTGDDRDRPATMIGIVKEGAGPDEGVPYKAPPAEPESHASGSACLVS